MLPNHRPYDCAIDLQHGAQPILGQFIIYQKMNLLNYVSILTKTLVKI
jgi:hypothetical protein